MPEFDLEKLRDWSPEVLDPEEENVTLRATMGEAFKVKPEQHAKVTKLSEETGAPVSAIEHDPEAIEQKQKLDNIDFGRIFESSPETAKFLNEFNRAVVAQDDVNAMERLERVLTPVADTLRSIPAGGVELFGSGLRGVGKFTHAVGRYTSEGIRSLGGEQVADFLQEPMIPAVVDPGSSFIGTGQLVKELAAIIDAPEERKGFHTMVGSALGQIAAFGIAPQTALTSFFASSYQQGVERAAAAGVDEDTQRAAGMLFGLSTLAAEKTGMDLIFNRIPPAIRNPLIRKTVDTVLGAGIEGAEEWIEGVTHQLIEKGLYDPDAEIELTPGMEEAAAGTAAGIMRLILGAMGKNARVQDNLAVHEAEIEHQGVTEQIHIDDINVTVQQMKMKEIAPEQLHEFIKQVDGDNNTNIFIDGEQTSIYLQDKTADEIEADPALKILNDQAREAAALGGDVVVPVADFATTIAGTPHFDALRQNMTMSGETISPARQEQDQAETQSYIANMMEQAQENVTEYVEAQEMYNDMREQLIDTGQVKPQYASEFAKLMPAWATVYAKDKGITLREAYDRAGLTVTGPQTGRAAELSAETLQQAKVEGYEGENYIEAAEWQRAVDKGLDVSVEARDQRAQEMGFDTDVIYYHGTPDNREIWKGGFADPFADMKVEGASPFFFSTDKRIADSYADDTRAFDFQGAEPETISTRLKMENPKRIDWKGESFRGRSDDGKGFALSDVINEAKEAGHDGLIVDNIKDTYDTKGAPGNVTVVFDPSQIRSINAAFDPDFKESGRLLAQAPVIEREALPENVTKLQSDLLNEARKMAVERGLDETVVDDVYIVGSRAKGTARPKSDLDVVVKTNVGADPNNIEIVEYEEALQELLDSRDQRIEIEGETVKVDFFVTPELDNVDVIGTVDTTPLAQAPVEPVSTETEAFKKWFGESKVVDEDGEPLVVYHGTGVEFKEFKPRRAGAVWFGDSAGYAGKYQSALPEAKNRVVSAYVKTENPFIVDMKGEQDIPDDLEGVFGFANTIEDVVGVAQQQGHDGVIFTNRKKTVEGFSSNEYAVFEPKNIKSPEAQLFDPTDPDIFRQPAPGTDEARGYYDPTNNLIRLTEATDLSTFLHEFAHFMYEMETRSPGKTLDGINKWFKSNAESVAKEASEENGEVTTEDVTAYIDNQTTGDKAKDDAISRAVHEQFARGFETYLMEGKAPSIELRNAFRKFARWLVRVYEAVKGDLKVDLDAEMRQVFDRMLATEEQIAAAEARAKIEPLFTDAAMAGMTEKEFAVYQQRQQDAKNKATETLRDKLIKELTRQQKARWKEEKEQIVEEELEALKKEPVYVAADQLRTGDVKLDLATVKEQFGEDITDELQRKSRRAPVALRGMTSRGEPGVHPDEAAALFGYASGAEMIHDLVNATKITEVADQRAEERMKAIHGDIMNDGSIEREADEALQNEERGKLLLHELKVLSRGTQQRVIERQTIKDMAEENIGKLSFRQIHPAKYRRAEIKAAQAAAVALAAGDKEAAAAAKAQQVLNYYLGMAATNAKNDIIKIADHKARYAKKSVREAIQSAGNEYWEQIVKILSRFEFRKSATLKSVDIENSTGLSKWVSNQIDNHGDELILSEAVMNELFTAHWKNVPYSTLQGIDESVRNIEHVARYSNKITLLEEKLSFDQLRVRVVDHLNKLTTVFKPSRITGKGPTGYTSLDKIRNSGEAAATWGREGMAKMTKLPFLTSWMDGGDRTGLMTQLLHRPTIEAIDKRHQLWEKTVIPVLKAMNSRSKKDSRRMTQKYHFPELGEGDDGALYGFQLLSVALNAGNAGNLRKMLIGEKWANPENESELTIGNPKLQAVLSKLNNADMELVQKIWDAMDSLYPQLADVSFKGSGVTPKKVEPVPITVNGVTYPGGYYTLEYDPDRSERAAEFKAKREAQLNSMFSTLGSMQQSVTAGSTHERTEYHAPILFDLNVITNHFQETIHYITHYDTVRQINKIISDPTISALMKEKIGKEEFSKLRPWLNDVAKDGRMSESQAFGSSLWRRLRFGTTYAYLGYKISTLAMQPLGLYTSASEIGKDNMVYGLNRMVASLPLTGGKWTARDFALANSAVLRHRIKNFDREFANAQKALEGKVGLVDQMRMMSMAGIGYVQLYIVDMPTWHGAYKKGLDLNEGDHDLAVQHADWVVDQTQGSGEVTNTAEFLRTKNEFARLFFSFMTYFSSLWNVQRDATRNVRLGVHSPAQFGAKVFYLVVATTLTEMFIRGELGQRDDEDDKEYATRVFSKVVTSPSASVPYMRDVVNGAVTGYGYNPSPALSMVTKGVDAVYGIPKTIFETGVEDVTKHQVKSAFIFMGALFNIPGTSQTWATGDHLYDVIEEGEDFSTHQFLFGPKRD